MFGFGEKKPEYDRTHPLNHNVKLNRDGSIVHDRHPVLRDTMIDKDRNIVQTEHPLHTFKK